MAERRSSVRRHIGGERNLLSSNQVKRDCWFKGNPYFNMISSNSTKSGTTRVLSWCGATRGSRTLCHTEMGTAMPAPVLSADVSESITVDSGSNDLSRSFSMSSSDDTNSNIMFTPGSKMAKVLIDSNGGMVTSLSKIESQFGMSTTSLDMPDMDDYQQLQQDFIACTVRTKHSCTTHPRSIAERVS
ncbi:transcription factor bHLH81-like [Triticum urartu]|uniref:transcription factor bHLH81-like n=1 Tax=Triticum urartu TaxID=4572 RepID=UPI0020445ABB|nr:transcription factor bHLH81-like [Triticum urartu]